MKYSQTGEIEGVSERLEWPHDLVNDFDFDNLGCG